ncbi:unnamed protein product [Ambrosiozyma monospora]|uniref:Unnamed protein product n=1 Tax=Ambrosiozyma monospora TaxID=43982 RepID=A0ACB5TCV1_AMBMO|nr:unnamed protein product [Ambrosiozyma monospora]
MAVKRTSELIPLCHPLSITKINVEFDVDEGKNRIGVEVKVECDGKTGVEMEAMTGASVGLLTVYDMCKAVDKLMVIDAVRVVEKKGGKSGDWKVDV